MLGCLHQPGTSHCSDYHSLETCQLAALLLDAMLLELRCLEREIHNSKWATLKLILQGFYMYNCDV